MTLKAYQIDAFANELFEGNPAMVIPLDTWLNDALMQKIAQENNLSETAFFVREGTYVSLRWFTPKHEVDLCGHATLASAYVLFNCLEYEGTEILFQTKSGILKVWNKENHIVMDFPIQRIQECEIPQALMVAFDTVPTHCYKAMDYILVFDNEADVKHANPDISILKELNLRGVCITAKSEKYDFVTRFFAPKFGVDEDPVTGSAFTQLVGYWQGELGQDIFVAKQLSPRGGEVRCEIKGERVEIAGKAIKYLEGIVSI